MPPAELAQILRLGSVEEAERVGRGLAGFVLPRARQLSMSEDGEQETRLTHLSTGDTRLDALLRGGLRTGMITEVVGESATGKSQLAMQLAVHTALGIGPDADSHPQPGSVALMLSEGDAQCSLFVQRMVQIAEDVVRTRFHHRQQCGEQSMHSIPSSGHQPVERPTKKRRRSDAQEDASGKAKQEEEEDRAVEQATEQFLRNIHLASIRDMDALEHVLDYTIPALAHRLSPRSGPTPPPAPSPSPSPSQPPPPLKLIILDNLPSLLYATHPSSLNAIVARSRSLCTTSDALKRLAASEGCAILVVNHVSDVFDRDLEAVKAVAQASMQGTQNKPRGRGGGGHPQQQPPLAYSQQAPFFSGLLHSYTTTEHTLRMANEGADPEEHEPLTEESIAAQAAQAAKQAALGHVWNNCVNARVMLCRTRVVVLPQGGGSGSSEGGIRLGHAPLERDEEEDEDGGGGKEGEDRPPPHPTPAGTAPPLPLRVAHLVFAPDAPSSSDEDGADAPACYYTLERQGLRSLPVPLTLPLNSHMDARPDGTALAQGKGSSYMHVHVRTQGDADAEDEPDGDDDDPPSPEMEEALLRAERAAEEAAQTQTQTRDSTRTTSARPGTVSANATRAAPAPAREDLDVDMEEFDFGVEGELELDLREWELEAGMEGGSGQAQAQGRRPP